MRIRLEACLASSRASELEGEVKGRTIYVYSGNPRAAVKTLRHEFLDYAVTQLIDPYKEVTKLIWTGTV